MRACACGRFRESDPDSEGADLDVQQGMVAVKHQVALFVVQERRDLLRLLQPPQDWGQFNLRRKEVDCDDDGRFLCRQ